jgi:hypothetical protein
VELLFERNLLPRLNPMAALVSNDFRTERLYTEEVDLLLKQHQVSPQDAAGHEQAAPITEPTTRRFVMSLKACGFVRCCCFIHCFVLRFASVSRISLITA